MKISIINESDSVFKEIEVIEVSGYGKDKILTIKSIMEEAVIRPNTTLLLVPQDPYEVKEIESELDNMLSGFERMKLAETV